jgi:acyl-CoA synthetase (AMP-forming)/AMP-acid ligase II
MSMTAGSLFEVVRETGTASPERLAVIVDDGDDRTYGELLDRAHRLMGAFAAMGLRSGDRICLCLDNRPEWIETYIAALGAGLITVPANPSWTPAELTFLLENSGARALVCAGSFQARAEKLRDAVATLERVLTVGPAGDGDVLDYEAVVGGADASAALTVRVAAEDPAMIVYTSGTSSGRPKGVVTSHRLLLHDVGLAYARVMETTPVDRCLFVTPLFHNNALGACLSALAVGASVVFPRRFSASRFWPLVDRYRPTYLFTMAPIMHILMAAPPSSIERQHGMRALFVLAAGANAEAIEERYGAPVIDCYGMSECPCGTYTRLGEERRPGSAGRAFPHVDLRIVRPDGSFAAPGEVGAVVFRYGRLFDGYFNAPEETARAVRDGWFHTGDLGRLDEDGFFYFVDREKDVIRRGGENISSQEVEAALRAHPAVADVAVVAVPDDVLGERVAAVVIPAGDEPPTLEELRACGRAVLAEYKLPERLVVRDELPRTGSGKIQKFAVREELAAALAAEQPR